MNYQSIMVIVNTVPDIEKAIKLISCQSSVKNVAWIATTSLVQDDLISRSLNCSQPEDFIEAASEFERYARNWSVQWAFDPPNSHQKSFLETFTYEDTSLWWFIEHLLYTRVFFPAIWQIEWMKQAVSKIRPELILFSSEVVFEEILESLSSDYKFNIQRINTLTARQKWKQSISKLARRLIRESIGINRPMVWHVINKLLRICGNQENSELAITKSASSRKRFLFLGYLQYVGSHAPNSTGIQDKFWPSIISHLQEHEIIVVEKAINWRDSTKATTYGRREIVDDYWSFSLFRKLNLTARMFSHQWNKCGDTYCARIESYYGNINCGSIINKTITDTIWEAATGMIINLETMKALLERHKPQVAVMHTEVMHHGRALAHIAGQHGVPTIALQHGVIYPRNRQYLHHPREMPTGASGEYLKCPIASITAVYGEYAQSVLINAGFYPPERVVITGQPLHDALFRVKNEYKRETLCAALGMCSNRPIITVMGQRFPENINAPFLSAVYASLKQFPNAQLLVKPHPHQANFDLYYQLANAAGVQIDRLIPDRLNEVLFVSDLVITINSTTAIEAVLLDKPVICVNLSTQPDLIPFTDSPAILGVKEAVALPKMIHNALYDTETRQRLAAARPAFVTQHAYRADGLSSQRVAGVISDLAIRGKR